MPEPLNPVVVPQEACPQGAKRCATFGKVNPSLSLDGWGRCHGCRFDGTRLVFYPISGQREVEQRRARLNHDDTDAHLTKGNFRQCSGGWHEECSDPYGDECPCPCHEVVDVWVEVDR